MLVPLNNNKSETKRVTDVGYKIPHKSPRAFPLLQNLQWIAVVNGVNVKATALLHMRLENTQAYSCKVCKLMFTRDCTSLCIPKSRDISEIWSLSFYNRKTWKSAPRATSRSYSCIFADKRPITCLITLECNAKFIFHLCLCFEVQWEKWLAWQDKSLINSLHLDRCYRHECQGWGSYPTYSTRSMIPLCPSVKQFTSLSSLNIGENEYLPFTEEDLVRLLARRCSTVWYQGVEDK